MKISTDIYAFIDEKRLIDVIEKDEGLKSFIDEEIARMTDEGLIKKCGSGCGGCGAKHGSGGHKGCCSGCGGGHDSVDAAYLTTALISVFNYYIPDDVKDAINMGGSTFVDEDV